MVTHGATATVCVHSQQWQAVLQLFRRSPLSFAADAVLCGITIDACNRGKRWELALGCLEQVQHEDIQANVAVLNMVIASCDKGGQWETALGTLTNLPKQQLQPDVVSFGAAISACHKCRNWEWAAGLFSRIYLQAMEGNMVIRNTAIGALKTWQEAVCWSLRLRGVGAKVDGITHNVLINRCGEGQQWQQGFAVFDEMSFSCLEPDVVTAGSLQASYMASRAWPTSVHLLGSAAFQAVQGDAIVLNSASLACEVVGNYLAMPKLSKSVRDQVLGCACACVRMAPAQMAENHELGLADLSVNGVETLTWQGGLDASVLATVKRCLFKTTACSLRNLMSGVVENLLGAWRLHDMFLQRQTSLGSFLGHVALWDLGLQGASSPSWQLGARLALQRALRKEKEKGGGFGLEAADPVARAINAWASSYMQLPRAGLGKWPRGLAGARMRAARGARGQRAALWAGAPRQGQAPGA